MKSFLIFKLIMGLKLIKIFELIVFYLIVIINTDFITFIFLKIKYFELIMIEYVQKINN